MTVKKKKIDIEKTKKEMLEVYKRKLDKIFDNSTYDLTFDEREKLIDSELDEDRCKVLEEHIESDPASIINKEPDDTCVCPCGRCATLYRDDQGNPKILERTIKTKRGTVNIKEYGYYCSHCRKVFFPSEKKAKAICGKLQS
jgi:DNA replication initiation complex subunit (GINS family)